MKPGFDKINRVSLRVFAIDSAVQHGPTRVIRWLQKIAGVPVDGILGPVSLEAINRARFGCALPEGMLAERCRFYGHIITKDPTQAVFAAGWANRLAGVHRGSMTASKAYLTAALAAFVAWLYLIPGPGFVEPMPVYAQGGDVAYRSVRTQIPIARAYLEPQGLQDADFDLLTSNLSTMSSTYQTILSGSVTVGEAGDAVTVHVTGQIGWMGAAIYAVDNDRATNCGGLTTRPNSRFGAVEEGDVSVRAYATPQGITSHGGALYAVDSKRPLNCGGLTIPTNPSVRRSWKVILFHPGLAGIAKRHHVARRSALRSWTPQARPIDYGGLMIPTAPGSAVTGRRRFRPALRTPEGITSHGGALYVVNSSVTVTVNCGGLTTRPNSRFGAVEEGDVSVQASLRSRKASRRTAGRSTRWTKRWRQNYGGSTIRRTPGGRRSWKAHFPSGLMDPVRHRQYWSRTLHDPRGARHD